MMGRGTSLTEAQKARIESLAELEWTNRAFYVSIKLSHGAVWNYLKAHESRSFRKRLGRNPKLGVHAKR